MPQVNALVRYRRPWIALLAACIVSRLPFCGRLAVWLVIAGAGLEVCLRGEWQPVRYERMVHSLMEAWHEGMRILNDEDQHAPRT